MLPRRLIFSRELTKTVVREIQTTRFINKKYKKQCCPETGRKKVADPCKKSTPLPKPEKVDPCKKSPPPKKECKPAIPSECSKETASQCMKQLQEIQKAYKELACESQKAMKEIKCKPKCEPPPCCCPPPKKRLGVISTILSTLGILFIANVIYCAVNHCDRGKQETNENEEESI